jgi:FAD synthetase
MVTVMVFGSFDLMHPGHLNFLRQAKSYGDKLVAVVARDSSIQKIKNFTPKYSERDRLEHIRDMPMVDKGVLGYEKDPYEIVEEINPDIICLGYDQNSYSDNLEEELKKREMEIKIIRLSPYRPDLYKSSKLK